MFQHFDAKYLKLPLGTVVLYRGIINTYDFTDSHCTVYLHQVPTQVSHEGTQVFRYSQRQRKNRNCIVCVAHYDTVKKNVSCPGD